MSELPVHLLFPLTSSVLFTVGALFVKRATAGGVSSWTLTLFANLTAAVVFSFFWPLGGEMAPLSQMWHSTVIAILYILGQICILSALDWGDVSVVTPVASVKVLLVAGILALFSVEPPSKAVWLAAFLATTGVVLINLAMPKAGRREISVAVFLTVAAATSFAFFDVALQSWSRHWGIGRLAPMVYWTVGLFSLLLLPWVDKPRALRQMPWKSVLVGSFLMAAQATCLVYALSVYQDAARINVVYAMRGLWGVILAWAAAKVLVGWFGGNEAEMTTGVMILRLIGASLLVTAVVITILEESVAGYL